MNAPDVRVLIATQDHLFTASVRTDGQRLLEAFNSPGSQYVTLREVQSADLSGIACRGPLGAGTVRKAQVVMVIATADKHESPDKRWNSYVEKRQHLAYVAVPGFDVTGVLHFQGTADCVSVLTHEMGSFFPLSSATVRPTNGQAPLEDVPTVIINKTFVSLLCFQPDARAANKAADTAVAAPSGVQQDAAEHDPEDEIERLIAEVRGLASSARQTKSASADQDGGPNKRACRR